MTHSQPANYLRELFESLPIAVLLADDDANYVDVNGAACELLQRERSELIGRSVSSVLAPGRAADVDIQWKAFLRDGEQSGEVELLLPDGSIQMAHFHARANFAPGLHCSFMNRAAVSARRESADGSLLTMCAWTKQVRVGDEWMSIEHYLADHHAMRISHGVAPDAFARLMRDARRV